MGARRLAMVWNIGFQKSLDQMVSVAFEGSTASPPATIGSNKKGIIDERR